MTTFVTSSLRAALAALILTATPGLAPADTKPGPGHGHGTAAVGQPGKASAATRTVKVTLADNYFEPESIQVKSGETVRFVLTNTGQLLHEFNIGTPDMHAEHQELMQTMVDHGMFTAAGVDPQKMKMDHGPGHGMKMTHDEPNSVLVEPGKTKELVWTFSKPGTIEFACNMPGHYQTGMVGAFTFQR